eukprot:c7111_g1_i3.p2 GENE.c7111_g1_i3~~c7111_g1_i3.p2  ORF type:complete len:143 (-),score=16.36 c7111_g1_i3:219-647(-)
MENSWGVVCTPHSMFFLSFFDLSSVFDVVRYHTDQNAMRSSGFQCAQGLVTLFDVTAETGGFVAVPQSHNHHTDVCLRAGATTRSHDFIQIKAKDPVFTACPAPSMICCKAGDIVLWGIREQYTATHQQSADQQRPSQICCG